MPVRRRPAADVEQLALLDLPDAATPPPRRAPAKRRGSPPDGELSEFLESLEELGGSLTGDLDPVGVELHGAAFHRIAEAGRDGDQAMVGAMLSALADHPTPAGLALVLAVQATAEGSTRQAATDAAARLVAAGVRRPAWADALAEPLTPGEFWRMASPSGDASVLAGSFHRMGATHVVAVTVDEESCGEASMIGFVGPDDLAELDQLLEPGSGKEALPPAEFRWLVESALRIRGEHDADDPEPGPDSVDEDELDFRVGSTLLRTRLAVLPALDRPLREHPEPDVDLDLSPWEMEARSTALAKLAAALLDPAPGPGRSASATRPAKGVGRGQTAGKGRPTPKRKPSKTQTTSIYQLKVTLRGSKPPIWRRLEVPANLTLYHVHGILQAAFDWDDMHLHRFQTPVGEFGRADPEFGVRADKRVTLAEVAPNVKSKIVYEYDFGDSWEHEIVVEKILDRVPDVTYPRCTGGRRAAPPEDCGGVWGYASLLDSLADPTDPDHEDALERLGVADPAQLNPDAFDADRVNRRLGALR